MNTHKILVVDDQEGILLLLKDLFAEMNCSVFTAINGKKALDLIYKDSFDLIILDYNLPIVTGREVLERLDNDGFKIPLILMSGLAEHLHEEKMNYRFIKKILGKPFNIMDMKDLVKDILA